MLSPTASSREGHGSRTRAPVQARLPLPLSAEQFIGPGGIPLLQRRVARFRVVEAAMVASARVGTVDEGLQVEPFRGDGT